jgi:hypothetical protein
MSWLPILMVLVLVLALACLVVGIVLLTRSQSKKNPIPPPRPGGVTTILIIGDSFTFKNNLPAILQDIMGPSYVIDCYTLPRLNLTKAYADPVVQNRVINGRYDYVVLQDQSARCFMSTKKFEQAASDWVDLIKRVGSKPVLFEPWAYAQGHADMNQGTDKKKSFCYRLYHYKNVPDRAAELCNDDHVTTTPAKVQAFTLEEYQSTASDLDDIPIIYVGEAWQSFGDKREDTLFNSCDFKHPNVAGSYFTALIIYKFFTGKKASDLPTKGLTFCADCASKTDPSDFPKYYDCCYVPHLNADCEGHTNPTVTIPPGQAQYLQKMADDFVPPS